jgi:hypothetical protein
MSCRSAAVVLTKDYQPADLMRFPDLPMRIWEEMRLHEANKRLDVGILVAGTTPNSQAAGVGNTEWHVGTPALDCIVAGVYAHIALAADMVLNTGAFLAGFINGYSCIARLVVKNVTGTLSVQAVLGTPMLTANVVPPSDAAVQAAVTGVIPWIEIGQCRLNRTGDATVTSALLDLRPIWGVNVGMALDL